jgi:transposase-like protein
MLTSVRYFDLVREMKNAYNHRLRLVESAKQRGSKPTARLFATTVPTVRKWLRRFEQHGPSGLVALPRTRHHQSQKTPPTTEAQLVELRKTLPTFGSRRLNPRVRSAHQSWRSGTHLARTRSAEKTPQEVST